MRIYMSDMYRVESSYPLDEIQSDILYYLYQPLIGASALSIYMMLYNESKRMQRFKVPASLDRLISCMGISLIDIENGILKLEGIGLLKSYKKVENGVTLYLFKIKSPLSLNNFFANQILSVLLQEALSEDDYKKTVSYFKISSTDTSSFEDVSVKFSDVFKISQGKKRRRKLSFEGDFKHQETNGVKAEYDVDMLYRCLYDYQISKIRLSDEDVEYAVSLALVYSIDPMTLAGLIKDSMTSQGMNLEMLKGNIKKFYDIDSITQLDEVYHKQPLMYKSQLNENSLLSSHMKYLDSLTPYDLLKSKQGGREPLFHDLKIVETLMVQLGLNPSVVNVLIEYVLGKCDNKLSKSYCEAVGGTLARKNVLTALEAYNILMNNQEEETDVKEEVKELNEVEDIDFAELLSGLGD